MNAVTRTTCPYCGVGCGVLAERAADGVVSVRGDPEHPANLGRLCSKGIALAQTLGHEGRLLQPEVDGRQVDWDVALGEVAARLTACIEEHGPDSVAFYASGQLLTEDYYVANKLMKGYIGTANIDTNSRLCMSSAVSGHVRAFGEDVVPVDYTDLDSADLIVLVGSNLAWCHPVLMQRILSERERRPELKLVVIDPRRTATAVQADLHLPLRSGADVMLFNGLLAWLEDQGCVDAAFVSSHTQGAAQALATARLACADIPATAQACGLSEALVQQLFTLFASTERTVTVFSQGVNQSSSGVDKVNAIINCHLLSGRIGRPGMGPFSITGQPNAMGGREVGGLSTQLAAHLSLEDETHRTAVQDFWRSPRIARQPGPRAVELFEAIDSGHIRAVWIMATNPVVSLPDADRVKRALARCPLVIVSDCVADNDTLKLAHIKLPAAAWAEKDGTVTNSDRHVSRQRAFLAPPGAARPDWWIVSEVARRMGFHAGFNYTGPAQIFDEHAGLTRVAARFGRCLDLTGMAGMSAQQYDSMPPQQWPPTSGGRPFANGRFPTPDGKARFIATPARGPRYAPTGEFPLILNTGRMRDQWHTMTRTSRATVLNGHEPEPWVDAHAQDLRAAGIVPGSIARVASRWGTVLARARSSGELPPGMLFMPIHWSECFAKQSRVDAAVNPVVDAQSGEPEFKHTPVRIEPVKLEWQGFLLSRDPVSAPSCEWWSTTQAQGHHRLEFAGLGAAPDIAWLRQAQPGLATTETIEFVDAGTGNLRVAWLSGGILQACLMVTRSGVLPARHWVASLFHSDPLVAADRAALLSGARMDRPDPGALVCACFGVGATAIRVAIGGGCGNVAAVGLRLKAGSNCGSCRSEIQRLINEHPSGIAVMAT
jgi:assimilatory nitrate reductase catalytic subunit